MQEKTGGELFGRLSKTRNSLTSCLTGRGVKPDESLYEKIEDQLIMANIGIEPAQRIINTLLVRAKTEKLQSARGGIVIAMAEKYDQPIRFTKIGESMGDLRPFDALDFATALLPDNLGEQTANGR